MDFQSFHKWLKIVDLEWDILILIDNLKDATIPKRRISLKTLKAIMKLKTGFPRMRTRWLMTLGTSVQVQCRSHWWTSCCRIWTEYGEPEKRSSCSESNKMLAGKSSFWEDKSLWTNPMIKLSKNKTSKDSKKIWSKQIKFLEKM
jgi:hypothetical protein